jgi:hypothetical protein
MLFSSKWFYTPLRTKVFKGVEIIFI